MLKDETTRGVEHMVRQATVELERRLRNGAPDGAERVLAAFPDLAARPETALEVIYTEFLIRQELGQFPTLSELQGRFPQWHRDLAQLFEVHTAVGVQGPREYEELNEPGSDDALELLEEINRGGMGVVYKARQKDLNRIVAVKTIKTGIFASAEERKRFRCEAEAVARLRHPNIVSIYGVGEWPAARLGAAGGDPIPYLTLEYVEGGSLEQKLAGVPWSAQPAARMVETLARAVHYAHQQGILHRDLKPANVLLTAEGTPKITDFGVAKIMVDADTIPGACGPLPSSTRSGAILGTPCYMAPEQAGAQRGPPGPGADIYALGAILYELVTGRPPHQATSPVDTLVQVRLAEPIPPRRLQAGLPRDLDTICLKCLRKAPERRYLSAAALADDLHCFLAGKPIQARPVGVWEIGWRWCRRNPQAAGLLALLLLALVGGMAGIFWQWRRAEARAAEAMRERERAEALFNKTWDAVERMTRAAQKMLSQPRLGPAGQAVVNDALAFYEEFLSQADDTPQDQLKKAQASLHVGQIRVWRDERPQAIEAFRLAATLFGSLHAADPDNDQVLFNLGSAYRALGGGYRRDGQFEEAAVALLQAIDLQEQLVARAPANHPHKLRLANYLVNYCAALPWPERKSRAEPYLRRAIAFARAVRQAEPQNRGSAQELAIGLDDLGILLWESRRAPEAEELCREAWKLRHEVAMAANSNHGARHFLARSHLNLGRIAADRSRQDEAETEFGQAVHIMEDLVKEYQRVDYRKDLFQFSARFAEFLISIQHHTDAARLYERAIQLCPGEPGAQDFYAWWLATCPNIALRDPAQALLLATRAVAAEPGNGDYFNTLGVAHFRNGNLKEARAVFEKSMQLRKGGDATDWFFLAMICRQSGDAGGAQVWFDRAVAWTAQNSPPSPELTRFRDEAERVLGIRSRE
jgi:tetratricopeptide (TPR) repeat protein